MLPVLSAVLSHRLPTLKLPYAKETERYIDFVEEVLFDALISSACSDFIVNAFAELDLKLDKVHTQYTSNIWMAHCNLK